LSSYSAVVKEVNSEVKLDIFFLAEVQYLFLILIKRTSGGHNHLRGK